MPPGCSCIGKTIRPYSKSVYSNSNRTRYPGKGATKTNATALLRIRGLRSHDTFYPFRYQRPSCCRTKERSDNIVFVLKTAVYGHFDSLAHIVLGIPKIYCLEKSKL